MNSKKDVFKNVSKISIIGGSGSGKSTLANILSKKLGIPAVHLDAINYKNNWVEIDKKERDKKIEEKANEDKWIIDGNYNKTLMQRLENADLVIWLDYSTFAQLKGVLKRYIQSHNKEKEELPGCKERFNLKFYKYVLTYNKNKRPQVVKMLEEISQEKVIVFKKQKDLNRWLENI